MEISKGLIFDIKRFAIHDGYGLRTTIFFKGCPLRCKWCQNPEGLSVFQTPVYFKNSCIHCQRCKEAAFPDQMIYQNDCPFFNLKYQGGFDNLIRICPAGAIRYDSQFYNVEELVEKIEEDKVFFGNTGGVTFSGGEPLMQGEFLIGVLKKCQVKKIHTAIETSLFAQLDLIKQVLPYLDLIYIDLKIFDEKQHIKNVGTTCNNIKKNIEYILKSKYRDKVIIRTPLIPIISATDLNIQQIVRFLVDIYPDVRYELLNYNPLASSKYSLVGLKYGLDENYPMFSEEQLQYFYDIAHQAGLKNLITE